MKTRRKTRSLISACSYFLAAVVVVSLAVRVYAITAEKSDGNERWIAIVMLCVIIVLAAACTVLEYLYRKFKVEKPVEKILDATDRIASGDFTVRLTTAHSFARYDEYDLIMENLNKMASELSKTEVLRTDFISNISHELKTPLAIIQNYAACLTDGELGKEERVRYAATLVSASKRLSDLIVNVLKLNKLENQGIRSETERVKLDDMLAETVLQFEELIEAKRLQLDCDLDEVTVLSSPSCLEIVWNNLLSNAIKFTESGGTIGVSLKSDGDDAVVKISDTGCGISPETGKHIFEKFYQGDTSHAQEGNGLGLALVKKVIDTIGGEITVESELGKGSVFTIVLHKNL
ncbi:MAG: ATP-binding protein [Candidatus Gallimonas sp.]